MRIYEIMDSESSCRIGVLLYYEKKNAWIIELEPDLDEWTAPLLFTGLVKRNIYTVPEDISYLWVKERVIPSGRQNIGSILTNHKLVTYDEMRFLEIAKGRCSQDSLYIRKLEELPDFVQERMKHNLTECFVSGERTLFCFFADDTVRKIDLSTLKDQEDVDKILNNPVLLKNSQVGTGGYSVTFGESVSIPAHVLYEAGTLLPLSLQDFLEFVRSNVTDTTESCTLLECSRQNLSYLQKKQLSVVKENVKGNLYLKGEILKTNW